MFQSMFCISLTVTGSLVTEAVNPAALLPLPEVYTCGGDSIIFPNDKGLTPHLFVTHTQASTHTHMHACT